MKEEGLGNATRIACRHSMTRDINVALHYSHEDNNHEYTINLPKHLAHRR